MRIFVIACHSHEAEHWAKSRLCPILGPDARFEWLSDIDQLRSIGFGEAIVFLAPGWQHNRMFEHEGPNSLASLRVMCRYRDIALLEVV